MESQSPYQTKPPSDLHYLDQAILRVLVHHQGRAHPISRSDLVRALKTYNASERQVREQIKQLRRAGHLIGSAPGTDGGYYLITTLEEFNDFMCTEYMAKIKDMSQTANAMTRTAQAQFGPHVMQPRLI